jgi:hypothetical protein
LVAAFAKEGAESSKMEASVPPVTSTGKDFAHLASKSSKEARVKLGILKKFIF